MASIITVVLGFLQICAGVVLLQLSKSAKDVPDAAVFKGDLDQVRTVAEQEEPETEPKADAIRGAAAIIRNISHSRRKVEAEEAKKVHEMRMKDQMEPIGENEQVEWDGLRRRKTVIDPSIGSVQRRKTQHPPLGMAHFPDDDDGASDDRPSSSDVFGSGSGLNRGFFNSFRRHASTNFSARKGKSLSTGAPALSEPISPGRDPTPPTAQVLGAMEMDHVYGLPPSLRDTDNKPHFDASTEYTGAGGKPISWADSVETRPTHSSGSTLAPPAPPPHGGAKRQFSFTNPFHRHKPDHPTSETTPDFSRRPSSRLGLSSRGSNTASGSKDHSIPIPNIKSATEEERLGLVKGDSRNIPDDSSSRGYMDVNEDDEEDDDDDDDDDWQLEGKPMAGSSRVHGHVPLIQEEKESDSSGRSSLEGYMQRAPPPRYDTGGGGSGSGAGSGSGSGNGGGAPAFI